MENNIVSNEKVNKHIYTFQFRYMLNSGLNINKAFREQVESNMALTFSSKTVTSIIKLLSKENTHVILLLVFMKTERT